MGYIGKLDEKNKAQEMRKEGLSYREILLQIHVSKDTLSRWCRDIELSPSQQKRLLDNKILGQRKGSLIAAENKRKLRQENIRVIFEQTKKQIRELSKRDRFIAGIALYAGDGDKGEGKSAFTNSDPMLINFMMEWFKEFMDLPLSKYRGAIWIHEGLDEREAKTYWSTLTGIPITQFHKTYIARPKADSKKIRKNIHQYGIFSIRFSDSNKQRNILGWISALVSDRIAQVH